VALESRDADVALQGHAQREGLIERSFPLMDRCAALGAITELLVAGIECTLRHLVEFAGGGNGSAGGVVGGAV
jgi:hypothetical protein